MINTEYLSELKGKGLCCYCCEGNRKQLPNCKQEVVNSAALICSMGKRRQEMLNRGTVDYVFRISIDVSFEREI